MECYKQRWVGAILVSALVAESRNCRHGFFSSSGTGCGIRGIAWAGLHDDVPEKGLTLSASCRVRRRCAIMRGSAGIPFRKTAATSNTSRITLRADRSTTIRCGSRSCRIW